MKRFFAPALLLIVGALGLVSSIARAQVGLATVGADHITISIHNQPYSEFYIGSGYPKPFLAPLRSATGSIVTRGFPMESIKGESTDHPHHRGLFLGYGSISGINFWENEFSYTTANRGKIVTRHIDDVTPGKKSGSVTVTFDWRDPGDATMLEERRSLTFYDEKDIRTIDIDTTFTAKVALKFDDTKEGFFAIRVADSIAEKNGGMITDSDGAQTEKNVWGQRANWVDYDGFVDKQKVGIVVFDNPANYNHPVRWHVRAYGLFAANPFGLKDFEPNSSKPGGYSMTPGQSLRFRYRVIIHPGDVPMKKISDWYSDYLRKPK